MKRFLVLAGLLCLTGVLLPAQAQQLRGPGALQALAAPVAAQPDSVIADIAAAAADPRLLDRIADPALRDFILRHPDWARDFAYAFAYQQDELWQQIDLLRQASGGYPPVAGIPSPAVPVVVAAPFLVAAAPVVFAPVAVARRNVVQRPAVVYSAGHHARHGYVSVGSPAVSRYGPPSRAAQLQNVQSAAFVARAQAAAQPSPAVRLQQQQFQARVQAHHAQPQRSFQRRR